MTAENTEGVIPLIQAGLYHPHTINNNFINTGCFSILSYDKYRVNGFKIKII